MAFIFDSTLRDWKCDAKLRDIKLNHHFNLNILIFTDDVITAVSVL